MAAPQKTENRRRALIADDEAAVSMLLSRVLTSMSWEVRLASRAEEVLLRFREEAFDAVLLDVDLGSGADGLELGRELLRLQPGLRLILMSGDPRNKRRAAQARLGPFLSKPFALAELRTLLSSSSQLGQ